MGSYTLGLVFTSLLISSGNGFEIFLSDRLYIYNFTGRVDSGAQNPDASIKPTNWIVNGLFQLQRIDSTTFAAWITPHMEVKFSPTKNEGDSPHKMPNFDELRAPFKIIAGNGAINYVALNADEPIWTANLKRAFASVFQIQAEKVGLLKVKEGTIHGFCDTEYLVMNKTSHYQVRKTVDMTSCLPHANGIHYTRSNIPSIPCKTTSLKKVIVGNEALYDLKFHDESGFYVNKAVVKGFTMVNIFESTGSAQYINSQLEFTFIKERQGPSPILIDADKVFLTSLEYVNHHRDPTAGRNTPTSQQKIDQVIYLLNFLTDILETTKIDFKDPIDGHVAETFRIVSLMDLESLTILFKQIDKGTSYRQETIRNLFLEMLPRIGTRHSVILTRDLVVKKKVKPITAVQLLISLPFHIDELSQELVQDCEQLLYLGSEFPDVKQAAVLSYATLIHHTYMAGKIRIEVFEKYLKKYFDFFLNSLDYDQQMLYLQALANLEQGNVIEYLEPIIKADYPQNTDIRFLAIFATMTQAQARPEKSYETYWPMFESKETPVQLRIAAFIALLYSNPTPARLLQIHDTMINNVTCPHLMNFYITTILSLKRTTYPCYQHLKEVVGFIARHLPKGPDTRYWINGFYLFDYIHDSGIGGLLKAMIIADEKTDIGHIGMFELTTEALGKYTGQMSVYIKARGVSEIIDKSVLPHVENIGLKDILNAMKLHQIPNTTLHFEMVIKMEGKAILSYHINQTIFDNLARGDILTSLATILMGDTHINMQSIRWPFMNKYTVPTVLGTPASVVIESTVATTLRGNITIPNDAGKLVRNQQIDMRYSSYSICQSINYNPFLNYEHQIRQEQGFFGYIPINNELVMNMQTKLISLSFVRPKNVETGFALKSKLSTGIYEFLLLGEMTGNYSQVIHEESEADIPVTMFNHEFSDLGLNVKLDVGYKGLYRNVFNPSENWFVEKNLGGFSNEEGYVSLIGNYILQLINIGHVSATHLGNYKYIKCVLDNQEDNRITALMSLSFEDDKKDPELKIYILEAGLEHYNDIENKNATPIHKMNGLMKIKHHPSSTKSTTQLIFKRITKAGEWRLCLESQYEPLIFIKKPENFKMTLFFGDVNPKTVKKCPSDKSKMEISGSFNIHSGVSSELDEMADAENESCPKKLIHFNIPISKCDKFNTLTKVTDYSLNIKSTKMPEWYTTNIRRLEHLYTSITTAEKTNWENGIDINVISPGDKFMNVSINGVSVSVLDFANIFNSDHDIKHHNVKTLADQYGFLHTCAVIGNKLFGYHDHTVDLSSHIQVRNNKSCSILIAADCSARASFAVFLEPVIPGKQFAVRYFIGDTSVLVGKEEGFVIIEKFGENKRKEKIPVKNRTFQPAEEYMQYSNFYINEDNILNVDFEQFPTSLQYNMENLLQLSTRFTLKSKVCGLCSPFSASKTDIYSYCFK